MTISESEAAILSQSVVSVTTMLKLPLISSLAVWKLRKYGIGWVLGLTRI
jgi:hypothetical protein